MKAAKPLLNSLAVVLILWGILTLWAEKRGGRKTWLLGDATANKKALIVFDPDPFYNLDEQVCLSFARSLAGKGFYVKVATEAAATRGCQAADLLVFCANTYNWRPDWAVTNFIQQADLRNKPVVAITLGAGSTGASKKALEKIIQEKGGKLLASRSFWLLRPNDESHSGEPNVKVALSMVHNWAKEIAAGWPLRTRDEE